MSTPKPKPNDPDELDEITHEIQRAGVAILVAADRLKQLERELDQLHARRGELLKRLSLFTLDE